MECRYELITMPNGETTLVKMPNDTQVRLVQAGETGIHQILDITEEQYQQLLQQAVTHHVQYDTITKEIMLKPKAQSSTKATQ